MCKEFGIRNAEGGKNRKSRRRDEEIIKKHKKIYSIPALDAGTEYYAFASRPTGRSSSSAGTLLERSALSYS
jgi:hypothetical protein